ncbi:MAG TPA: helix-turn-helix domain-containing protein [Syntrophomonas sp.]|nr:helix-turn-helix domain-containing protein [Syntrophomonas sp.]
MPEDDAVKYQLLEELIEKGLEAVVHYLRSKTGKPFIICTDAGKIYHPAIAEGDPELLADRYIVIPEETRAKEYSYLKREKKLFYRVGQDNVYAYIIVCELENSDCGGLLPSLQDTDLALKSHFSNLKSKENLEKTFKNDLFHDLLYKNSAQVREILQKNDKQKLDINQTYCICMIDSQSEFNIDAIYSFSKEWFESFHWVNHVPIIWKKSLLVICPVHFNEETLEIDYDWERHYVNMRQHKKALETKFKIEFCFGVGGKYPLLELHKSYTEARTALHVSRLMGEKGFLKHYHDLGIFSLLFMHDHELLIEYCYKILGRVIEYDREYDSKLLEALRRLFNTNMNWKETANSMFIHVNTLRYRMNKIEELLMMDLSTSQTQAVLFITLTLYDSLVAMGFIKDKQDFIK